MSDTRPSGAAAPVDEVTSLDATSSATTAALVGEEPAALLAADLAAVARELHDQPTTELTLERLVELAVELVSTCEDAGVSLEDVGGLTTAASTSDLPRLVDEAQNASGEGPVLDALRSATVFRTDDISTDARWPAFRERAAELGVRSIVCFRLSAGDSALGALTLYSRRPAAFDDGHFATGAIFAAHATVAFASAREADASRTLRRAVDSNRTIGMAMGILMATVRVDEDAAFELLKQMSSTTNRKLVDVAADVVRSGSLPGAGDAPTV
jgi:GAF domain-containing protein